MFITEKFEEICELVTDGTHDSPKLKSTGVPFIKGKHISKGTIDFENCDYISEEDHKKVKKRVEPQKDDILFSNIGSVGDTARINSDIEFSIKNVALFRANCEKIHADYLYYLVKSSQFREKALQLVSGSAQPFISLANLRRFKVEYLRDKEKQKRIASILSTFDNLIENNSRRIEILEEMAQRIYREWFVNFRYSGHEDDKLMDSNTELGAIPEGWEVKTLESFGEIVLGKTPSTKDLENYGGYMPFIKTPVMHNQVFIHETSEHLSKKGVGTQSNKTIPANSIIVNCIGAKAGVVSITAKHSQTNQQINSIVIENFSDREYLYFLLKKLRPKLRKAGSTGATMINVSKTKFARFLAVIPRREILDVFHSKVSGMLDQINTIQKQNIRLKEIRDLLLPKLISGKIDVEELESQEFESAVQK